MIQHTTQNIIQQALKEHRDSIESTINKYAQDIESVALKCIKSLEAGGKVIIFGNGGSAADAQHIAAELVGSFSDKKRKALPAIALTTDSSALTSISNDYEYESVFARQLQAFVTPKDIVIGISTSGNSANVVKALQYSQELGAYNIGLSGGTGGAMNTLVDTNFIVHSNSTARIQETHIFIGHMLCDIIDKHFLTA